MDTFASLSRCDRCAAGYWGFAFCQLCECDLRGSEADICSQVIHFDFEDTVLYLIRLEDYCARLK